MGPRLTMRVLRVDNAGPVGKYCHTQSQIRTRIVETRSLLPCSGENVQIILDKLYRIRYDGRMVQKRLSDIETPLLADEYAETKRMRRRDRRIRVWLWMAGFSIALLACVFAFVGAVVDWRVTAVAYMAGVIGAVVGLGSQLVGRRRSSVHNEVWRRLASVPGCIYILSRQLYDDDTYPWECSAIECHEAHHPGDCPLCGAA